MLSYSTTLEKFASKGEKSGWTYLAVTAEQAEQLKPGHRKSFKVKGKLDRHVVKNISLLPMGDGSFILPVNATLRKALGKREGAVVKLQLQEDNSEFVFNAGLMECLADEPRAAHFFRQLPGSHQRYFSKWIDDAKTEATRVKRIATAVNALTRQLGFGEMLRAARDKKDQLGN